MNIFNRLLFDKVWKWEGERPANLSSNTLTKKWLPQHDVLGYPAVGAFFTHGGLLSLQETTDHGVPIVALSLISDQPLNAQKAAARGIKDSYGTSHRRSNPTCYEESFLQKRSPPKDGDPEGSTNPPIRSSCLLD